MIAGLQGERGCARPRPPYPTEQGREGAPTVVNNVETLAAVPWIVGRGGAAYARRGTAHETGTRLVCLSERFARPGAYEVELGTPVARIAAEFGGGLRDGMELAVLQVGGPLGGFLPADGLDVPLTEEGLATRGAALGHAGLVAFDTSVEPADVLRHISVVRGRRGLWRVFAVPGGVAQGAGVRRGRGAAGCGVLAAAERAVRGQSVRVRASDPARSAQPGPRVRRPVGGVGAVTKSVEVAVDGTTVAVPDGSSVLAAVRAAGAWVPSLCHDDRFSPAGSCRTCLVRVDGRVAAACVTPAAPGARIEVDSDDLSDLRRDTVELIGSALPPRALTDGGSELADTCAMLGVDPGAAQGSGGRGADASHPYVHLDRDLCIACGRCVRICSEVQGTFALTLVGRGADTVVAPGTGGPWAQSDCVSCGGCVDTCPTGAITTPGAAGITSGRQLAETTRTTCGYCGVGCTLDVVARDGEVAAVLPARDGAVNRGHACVKGRFAHGYVRSPERLTQPLLRRHGVLEPVGWDEALAYVARGFSDAVADAGPDAVALISSARATNEENYLLQKFMRVAIGTNNIDNCSRLCHAPSAAGLTASFGLAGGTDSFDDVEQSDCFLVVGANPVEAHPVVGARLLQSALRGAALLVADPREVGLADHADVHLRPRPGTNVALFHGLAHVLLRKTW
ncbi:molybdopterin-dependent oxidoreductase [Yinghuangia aomiensis]